MDEQTRKAIAMHRSLPVTTRDLQALNERVTELRRKMPDDEPATILQRLHDNGEFLWADEALHEQVEAALSAVHLGRVYNEIYCHGEYTTEVEDAVMALAKQHPEWGLDMSRGAWRR